MGRRRFTPQVDTLEARIALSGDPPTNPVDAPPLPPGGNVPTIIAPVPAPDPNAPVIA